jgi:hypothetical protein
LFWVTREASGPAISPQLGQSACTGNFVFQDLRKTAPAAWPKIFERTISLASSVREKIFFGD